MQTGYMVAFESLKTANYYVNSNCVQRVVGENDKSSLGKTSTTELTSSNSSDKVLQVIDDMISGLKYDDTTEWSERLSAVTFMTFNYYIQQDSNQTDSGVKFGDAPDATTAKVLLITRRLEAFMNDFMCEVNGIQEFYNKNKININEDYIDQVEFSQLVSQYSKGRIELLSKTFKKIFAAIRDAFMLGNGICICNGTAKIDEQLLVSN